ncbi:MAG: PAS domain-containing protein [Pseudomonadota bacterium]
MDLSESRYRIVLAEDSDDDAELIALELRPVGLEMEFVRVWTEDAFVDALAQAPDLIICDYAMPQFDALRALALVQRLRPGLPLIVISRAVGEEVAVEAMRRGAADYLLKDRLTRLPEAVRRVLERSRLEREKARIETALDDSRRLLALRERAVECSSNAIAILDARAPHAPVTYANAALLQMTGLPMEEVAGRGFAQLFARGGDPAVIERLLQSVAGRREARAVLRYERGDGAVLWSDVHLAPVTDAHGGHVVAVMTDVTESRVYLEQLERASNYDALTGLPNRNLLADRLQPEGSE